MIALMVLCSGCWVKDYGATIVSSIAVAIATCSAWIGVKTYKRSVQTRRAEFILQLHKAFFVESTFRRVRRILDNDDEEDKEYLALLENHDEDFIDFLNYFELLAYLEAEENISLKDVEALAGYYLRTIKQRPALRKYVGKQSLSFEHLQKLLDKIKK